MKLSEILSITEFTSIKYVAYLILISTIKLKKPFCLLEDFKNTNLNYRGCIMQKITEPTQIESLENNKFIGELPKMRNSTISFFGENNILFCDKDVVLSDCNITFNGSNSVIYLSSSSHAYKLNVTVNHDNVFYVGTNNYFNGVLNAVLSEQKHIFIGNEGLFSFGIWLRVADPHLVYSVADKKRRNFSKSIFLGYHVWIGQSAMILKGSKIHSGSIVGALSVVANKEILSNTSWAGNPSQEITQGIFWDGTCVHGWTDTQTQAHMTFNSDKYVYKYQKNHFIDFAKIDTDLSQANSSDEKYCILKKISDNTNKNRFAYNHPEEKPAIRKLFSK